MPFERPSGASPFGYECLQMTNLPILGADDVFIARIIEEELLSDILSNSALSSWFNRVTIRIRLILSLP